MTSDNELPVPFFSGLCLEGEVAGQYELEAIDGSGDEPVNRGPATAGSTPELLLEGLGPITIFVGANNSGKSRLMRELFKSIVPKHMRIDGCSDERFTAARKMSELVTDAQKRDARKANRFSRRDPELSNRIRRPIDEVSNDAAIRVLSSKGWFETGMIDYLDKHSSSLGPLASKECPEDRDEARDFRDKERWKNTYESLRKDLPQIFGLKSIHRCYVPMLRGMRPPRWSDTTGLQQSGVVKDIYRDRTISDYFDRLLPDESITADSQQRLTQQHYLKHEQLHIFTGLGLYADLQDRMLSPEQEKRQSIIAYQQFLSDHFFAGQPVLLVPALKKHGSGGMNDVVYIKIGDKADYPIHELGDGMQSLIICTYPIVTETRRGCLFFLEEPDLCMHPSLQRTFLEVLKHYHRSMGHQFFLTTHSNHLLDLVDDPDLVSVLSFSEISGNNSNTSRKREPEDSDQQASSPAKFRIRQAKRQDRDLLNQLGVRPSATFLANATIWVEGISDVAYLRVYMEAFRHYLKHWGGEDWQATATQLSAYKEDNHYAFVEYSGANLTHLIFTTADQDVGDVAKPQDQQPSTDVCSLCGHAIVIADGDITDNRKGQRAEAFLAQLGERLIILPGKEVENLIPEDYAKKQVDDDHNGKGRCGIVSPESIDKISYSEYRQWRANGKLTGMGDYLNHLEIEKYRPSKSSGSQGTLPATYKQRWRSTSEGIPCKIREALKAKPGQNDANSEDATKAPPSLPDYMNRDLIWLCTCIYTHIAQCNHHEEAHRQFRGLREWMLSSKDCHSEPLSTECGETANAILDAWPIHNPCARECVLQSYATKAPLTS